MKKDALAVYEDCLRELDQHNAPLMDVGDYNYFIRKAISGVRKLLLKQYSLTQEIDDLLSFFHRERVYELKDSEGKAVWAADFPEDYYRLDTINYRLRFTEDFRGFKKGALLFSSLKRLTTQAEGLAVGNPYLEPCPEDPYYQTIGGRLRILVGGEAESACIAEMVLLKYFRNIGAFALTADYSPEEGSEELPEELSSEVVNVCVRLFLENQRSQRLQTQPVVNQ